MFYLTCLWLVNCWTEAEWVRKQAQTELDQSGLQKVALTLPYINVKNVLFKTTDLNESIA